MNTNIIKKCLTELQKENFRKDYVIGMLETLYEMTSGEKPPVIVQEPRQPLSQEEMTLNKMAASKIASIKDSIKYE